MTARLALVMTGRGGVVMAIFPVKINKWFFDPESAFYKHRECMKVRLSDGLECHVCGKLVSSRGYAMHSICHGGPNEAFCSLKCIQKW